MKKFIFFLLVLSGTSVFGQEQLTVKETSNPELTCDSVRYFPATRIVEFLGNVKLHTDIIEIEKAEKIVLDQTTQEIIASGLSDFTFDGEIRITSGKENKTVRYKIGERIAYVE